MTRPALVLLVSAMRAEADVLAQNGAVDLARVKVKDADAIESAEPDAVRVLSESEAQLRTGWTLLKVRKHAALFQHTGHAWKESGRWRMLAVVVPQRVPRSVLEEGARMEAAS
jgi:hypothetical protein